MHEVASPSKELLLAGRSLARGDYAGASAGAARVPSQSPAEADEARLIIGVAARGRDDFAAAAAALAGPTAGLGLLEPYRLAYLGDAEFYAGEYGEAAKAFAEARATGIVEAFSRRMTARLADALLADGRPCEAAKVLREAAHPDNSPERLDALIRSQAGCAADGVAAPEARRLWLDFPDHPAAQALDAAEGAHATASDWIHRATRLLLRADLLWPRTRRPSDST